MEKSIKKFKGNSGVGSDTANMAIKTEDVMITSQIVTRKGVETTKSK